MSKPYIHARSSVRKYGGIWEDYIDIHNFMDESKSHIADVRHRAIFHSSFGCFIAEKVFGVVIVNTEGKTVSVRDIAEDHIIEDLGFIPSLDKWFTNLPIESWMGGPSRNKRNEDGTAKPEPQPDVGPKVSIDPADMLIDGPRPNLNPTPDKPVSAPFIAPIITIPGEFSIKPDPNPYTFIRD